MSEVKLCFYKRNGASTPASKWARKIEDVVKAGGDFEDVNREAQKEAVQRTTAPVKFRLPRLGRSKKFPASIWIYPDSSILAVSIATIGGMEVGVFLRDNVVNSEVEETRE